MDARFMIVNQLKTETVYDDLWRLTQDQATDAEGLVYREDFQYDPVGNRLRRDLAERGHVERIDVWTYDNRDRIETHNGRRWIWDRGGRVREQPGWWDEPDKTYRWWLDDHLLEASTADGTTVTTTYDTDGTRIESTETVQGQTKTTSYLVDDSGWLSHVVADVRDDETTVYTRNGDQLLGLTRDTLSYYHPDGLGSIRTLTDPSGAVTEELDYSAFGRLLDGDLSVQRYTFTGEPRSAMGLSYHRARWMDPRLGRFLSMDPVLGQKSNPLSQNKFLYSNAEPARTTDPSGLFGITTAQAGLAVGIEIPKIIDLGSITSKLPAFFQAADTLILEEGPRMWAPFEPHILRPVAQAERAATMARTSHLIASAFSRAGFNLSIRVGNFKNYLRESKNRNTRAIRFVESGGIVAGLGFTPPFSAVGRVRTDILVQSLHGISPLISMRNGIRQPAFQFAEEQENISNAMAIVAVHEFLRTLGFLGSLGECREYFMCSSVLETDISTFSFHPDVKKFLRKRIPHKR